MLYMIDNDDLDRLTEEEWYSSNVKEILQEYREMLKSGRKLSAGIFMYNNGDEQFRIYEYDKKRGRVSLIKKIEID